MNADFLKIWTKLFHSKAKQLNFKIEPEKPVSLKEVFVQINGMAPHQSFVSERINIWVGKLHFDVNRKSNFSDRIRFTVDKSGSEVKLMLNTSLSVSHNLTNFKVSFEVNKTLKGSKGGQDMLFNQGPPLDQLRDLKHSKIFPTQTDIHELLETIDREKTIDYMVIHFTPLNLALRHFNAAPGQPTLPEICLTVTGEVNEYF